jgi:hypothetical protein
LSYIDQAVLAPIRARLSYNRIARQKYGALIQDRECLPGEAFYGNLGPAEFEALPLRTKRKGGPAKVSRLLSKVVESPDLPDSKKMGLRVFVGSYEELYGDKESFGVFVHSYELDMLGIGY